jgi:hypothetical protein
VTHAALFGSDEPGKRHVETAHPGELCLLCTRPADRVVVWQSSVSVATRRTPTCERCRHAQDHRDDLAQPSPPRDHFDESLCVRFSGETLTMFDRLAQATSMSRSAVVRELLDIILNTYSAERIYALLEAAPAPRRTAPPRRAAPRDRATALAARRDYDRQLRQTQLATRDQRRAAAAARIAAMTGGPA